MKPSIMLTLLIVFAIALPASGGNLTDDVAVNFGYTSTAINANADYVRNIGSVELAYDNLDLNADIVVGPRRDDEGPDWIINDDNNFRSLTTGQNYWSRSRFTPNATFVLWGVRFMPLNQGPNADAPCEIRVYSEDQNSHNLVNLLWEGEIEELRDWIDNDDDNNWHWIELPEDGRLEFGANESFSIIYGPAPGGAYRPGTQGAGWWNLYDGAASNPPRSFVANAVSNNHNNWGALGGDLFIRANGEYTEDFIDVGVTGMFNESEQWLMLPGTEQSIVARIENFGNDVQDLIVTFNAYTLDYEPYWNGPVEMIIANIDAEEVIEVTCDSTFSSDEVGNFIIVVDVNAVDDSNPDNDIFSLEQIVFDPTDEENEFWVGYCGDVSTSASSGNDQTGWMTAFKHPGGENALTVRQFRQFLASDNAVDCRFAIALYDGGQNYDWVWEGTAECNNADGEWVTVELSEDEMELTTFNEGWEVWICYYYANGVPVRLDGSAPVAGVNDVDMPLAMRMTQNGGNSSGAASTGDYMCQALFGTTTPTGALLRIEPDPVVFGDVNIGEAISIEATFTAYGDQDVEISAMQVLASGVDYLSVDTSEFVIAAQSAQTVTLRFYTDVAVEMDTRIRIIHNAENMQNPYVWNVTARALSVDDYQDQIPGEFELMQNHPNPFNPVTSIDFALKTNGMVNLSVFDMNGRQVGEVVNGFMNAGYHTVEFNAVDLPAGIYVYRISAGDFTSVRKMVLMK